MPARSITGHVANLEPDIREAIAKYRINPPWAAASLALYTQAVLQGAFIIAKAKPRRDNREAQDRCEAGRDPALSVRRRRRCDRVLHEGLRCR
jgi:hypothetical protein